MVPTKALGQGIIVRSNQQIVTVQSRGTGVLQSVVVEVGDQVEAGAPLAEIVQDDLILRIDAAKARLTEIVSSLEEQTRRIALDIAAHEDALERQKSSYQEIVSDLDDLQGRVEAYNQKEEELLAKGLVRRTDMIAHMQLAYDLLTRKFELSVEIATADTALLDLRRSSAEILEQLRLDVEDQRRHVANLEAREARERFAVTSSAGVVEEIRISSGELVNRTDTLVTLAAGGDGHEVLAFLRPDQGSRVKAGMAVHVIPTTVRKYEFGSIRGEVLNVSEQPVSLSEIRTLLQNEGLVDRFVGAGEPYLARIRMFEDADRPSGFQWWSGEGAPFLIDFGTLADVEIVVREQPPISLILPAIREFLEI